MRIAYKLYLLDAVKAECISFHVEL